MYLITRQDVLPGVSSVVATTAVALDLKAEWFARNRHAKLAPVWILHRPWELAPIITALQRKGIATHARGIFHRTLLQLFGPFVPIQLFVPPESRDRALEIVSELTGTPRQPV